MLVSNFTIGTDSVTAMRSQSSRRTVLGGLCAGAVASLASLASARRNLAPCR
jgi:hypothetical protein